jgi:hypothetical protein
LHYIKNIKYFVHISIFLLIFLGIQSCSLKQTLYINKNSSGNIDFELTLAPFFVEVTEQLAELFPDENNITENDSGPFNLKKIKDDFGKNEGSDLESLENPSDNILKGSIAFDDITKALAGDGSNDILDIFNFAADNNRYKLSVELNYETVGQFLLSNPSLNSPLMESFGPMANKGLNENDYLDMMEFALGEKSRLGIKESFLLMDVNVDGKIVSQSGGTLIDQDTVRFEIPLLKILLLDESQSFSVSFVDQD